MVIVKLSGGLGNQFCQYSTGRLLAQKLQTILKLDLSSYAPSIQDNKRSHARYMLGSFNVLESFITPEEANYIRQKAICPSSFEECKLLCDPQKDIFLAGPFMHRWPTNLLSIGKPDILRKDFTLKEPFSPNSEAWRQKILSAECSVSMHFRHGDYAYRPGLISGDINVRPWYTITPLYYYYTCISILKQRYQKLNVFVFSDNLPWVKDNLKLDVPTEFIEGCESDQEEFLLMSYCKHNIIAYSSFSRDAAFLNQNPEKRIFWPAPTTAKKTKQYLDSLTPNKKDSILNSGRWNGIPFDYNDQPEITMRPIFSLLLVVNNDAETLSDTLNSLLGQDYKYYEVIIIDNASTDGSDKICQQAIVNKANVTYKRLESKVSNATALNTAIDIAQGKYVSFLKCGDRLLLNALTMLYLVNEYRQVDIIHMFASLAENEQGTIAFADKKYSEQRDTRFKDEKRAVVMGTDGQAAAKLLLDGQINRFLGTKIYNRDFLKDNGIKFDEHLANNEAELAFQAEAFSKSKYFMHISNAFYVAPKA